MFYNRQSSGAASSTPVVPSIDPVTGDVIPLVVAGGLRKVSVVLSVVGGGQVPLLTSSGQQVWRLQCASGDPGGTNGFYLVDAKGVIGYINPATTIELGGQLAKGFLGAQTENPSTGGGGSAYVTYDLVLPNFTN